MSTRRRQEAELRREALPAKVTSRRSAGLPGRGQGQSLSNVRCRAGQSGNKFDFVIAGEGEASAPAGEGPMQNRLPMTPPSKRQATPLTYRMAASVAPLPKRGIEVVHRSILNRLRKYSATSIAELALQILWNPPTGEAEEVRSAPWLTLLLVKWALQDNLVNLRVGPAIPSAEFDRLRQELWDLQGPSHGEKPNVWAMLRYLVHVQVEFQRSESWGFLRWPALYARLDPGSVNRRQFREGMGLEPEAFLDLAYGLYAAVLNRQMPLGRTTYRFSGRHTAQTWTGCTGSSSETCPACVRTCSQKKRSVSAESRNCSSSRTCAVFLSCACAMGGFTAGIPWSSPEDWKMRFIYACPASVRTMRTSSAGCTSDT